MDLITLEEFKDFNGITKPQEDGKHSMLISMVSALIQTYLGLSNAEGGQTITETINIDYDTNVIYLDHYPIASITSISELDRYTTDSTVHVPLSYSEDYSVNLAEGIITRIPTLGGFANWPISPSAVVVTYVTAPKWLGGSSGVPADLKLATIELVNYYKNEEFRQSKTVQGSTVVNTLASGGDFPKHIQVILDRYR